MNVGFARVLRAELTVILGEGERFLVVDSIQIYNEYAKCNPVLYTLVDRGLGQVVDLLGTILELAVGKLESAKNTGSLGHRVIASQLVVGNAVQSATAWD